MFIQDVDGVADEVNLRVGIVYRLCWSIATNKIVNSRL